MFVTETLSSTNRENGVYYTSLNNPFNHEAFIKWFYKNKLNKETILEPFAGNNNIIKMLRDLNLCSSYKSYDILPKARDVTRRDTITFFPKNFNICVSNPPWLYKSSALRRNLYFPNSDYDNLYKVCVDLSLRHCKFVAMLIPASFLLSWELQERLEKVIFINGKLFEHTENPVCLALFSEKQSADTEIYQGSKLVGLLGELKSYLPKKHFIKIKFNDNEGNLGLMGIDNTNGPSIKFCKGKELSHYNIVNTSRSITRISGLDVSDDLIEDLNKYLNEFRKKTKDTFLTPFKGLRKDGYYRKRINYRLARDIIGEVLAIRD